jgi:hypothetical protein
MLLKNLDTALKAAADPPRPDEPSQPTAGTLRFGKFGGFSRFVGTYAPD